MAADYHFYQNMFTTLDTALSSYVSDTASNIIAAITPVAYSLLMIYVMLWGWSMIRGVIQEPITDGFTRIIRLSVITTIALQIGYYNSFLSDWLWNSPDVMAAHIGGDSGENNAEYLDTLTNKVFDFGDIYKQKSEENANTVGIPDLSLLATAILIWFFGVAATAYAGFLLALSKMALAIILAIGPIFVLTTIFEATKQFFNAWLGQALNYVFLVMLSAAAVKLILTILEHYLNAAAGVSAGDPGVSQALPAIAFSLIGFLVLMQMPSIASALGGGVAISTLGAVGAAYAKAKGAAGSVKNLATGKTLSDWRGARRMKAKNAEWAAQNPFRKEVASKVGRTVGAPMAVYRRITGGSKNRVSKA